jgi:broad specificity phosphatase PhoE
MEKLKNKYFILRHGESEANVAGLITSNPAQCIKKYGLTKYGRKVVAASVEKAKLSAQLDSETIIYTSDFKRTVETAEIATEILNAGKVHLGVGLRERSFGLYDGKQVTKYIEVWPTDETGRLEQLKNKVESGEEILVRLTAFIRSLENRYREKTVLLVSHGDPLQVLQAYWKGLGPNQARLLPYLQPGELRELT